MLFWMKRNSAGISKEFKHRIDAALSRGSMAALALLAFSSVGREGIETTLFLFAGSTNESSDALFVTGGVLGFVIAAAAGVVLYYGSARLPLKQFFLGSAIVLMVLAAGLLTNALSELHEATIIRELGSRPWDTESSISMTSTLGKFLHTVLGYDSAPAISQIVLYWTYLVVVLGAYLLWPAPRPARTESVSAPAKPESLAEFG
jgi:high-affinity iron transporter